ncbi:uncharacterized protein K444DRAFT_174767 [Hyaloscypha bicolor E]|uniref:Uncharacterized protein n=1 Tax=Hyaloscypha bicolor E TaxID=1095630 RepID=A0A2J6TQD8_9HELO|nr:uncharacterized protein K444DRAFT_174767 [Hyaloscypha bicolor E]PMD65234.1 hypothetical protein K444DRAFT_174767 [Hyaloscypha bicolor E]
MRRPSGPRRLSGAWGGWDEVGGKRKCSGTEFEGQRCDARDSNMKETTGQTYQRILYQGGGGSGVVAARAQRCWRISRIWEWNGVGGEDCCRPVLCWARNSWGPPSWAVLVRHWLVQLGGGHSIGHGSSSSCPRLPPTPPSLALTVKRSISLLAPHSPNQTGVGSQASSQHPAAASHTRSSRWSVPVAPRHPWFNNETSQSS